MRSSTVFLLVLFFCTAVILYAAEALTGSSLRFSHKTHTAGSINCSVCHSLPSQAPDAAIQNSGWQPLKKSGIVSEKAGGMFDQFKDYGDTFGRPAMERCLNCHSKDGKKNDCVLCHFGSKPGKTVRQRIRFPEQFKFTHKAHEDQQCSRCHGQTAEYTSLDSSIVDFSMNDCLECHNNRNAPKNCTLCHSPCPRPRDHTRNYEKKHGTAYRSDPQQCSLCHEDSSCVSCHSRKPKDHTIAWQRRRHKMAAKTDPQKCQACHSDPYVCRRCHNDK